MPYRHRHYSSDMSPMQIIITIAIILMLLILISFFSNKSIVRRKLKKAPLRRLADFKHGETAKITGAIAFVDAPLIAPLSGRECAWYRVEVQVKRGGKNSRWETIINEENKSGFVIRDADKVAFIDDSNVQRHIVQDVHYSSGFLNDPSNKLAAYLKKHGHTSENFLGFNKSIRYHEGVLEKGETIVVLGKGEWHHAFKLGLPHDYGNVLAITSGGDIVCLTDDINIVNESKG